MSSKRQKVDESECLKLIRPLLEQYMISDLVAIILDEYISVAHWITCNYRTPRETWQKLSFPCAPDCKTNQFVWLDHKLDGADIKGPFRLRNLTRSSQFLDDNGLLVTAKVLFEYSNDEVECTRGIDASITLGEFREVLRGKGVNDLVNKAVEASTEFLARYKNAE